MVLKKNKLKTSQISIFMFVNSANLIIRYVRKNTTRLSGVTLLITHGDEFG